MWLFLSPVNHQKDGKQPAEVQTCKAQSITFNLHTGQTNLQTVSFADFILKRLKLS